MKPLTRLLLAGFVLLVLPPLLAGQAKAQSLAFGREYEPVVIEGSALADWVNQANINTINLYAYLGNGVFDPIPFQLDKRRKVNLVGNMNPGRRGDRIGFVCEYGYFPEKFPPPSENGFTSDLLQSTDEIVFLLQDAGTLQASPTVWLNQNVQNDRYEFILTDGRTGAKRYVYAYLWNGTPTDFDPTDYVNYTQDVPTPPGCAPGPEACGRIVTDGTLLPTDAFTYNTHFGHNWATDAFEIKEKDASTPHPDILFRLQYCEGNCGETEDTWANVGDPQWLGVKDGKVRVVRGVQGAASGPHTTKYEFAYPTQLVTRVNLRVHPIQNVNGRADHEPAIVNEDRRLDKKAYVWQETTKAETGTYLDEIEGQCNGCPLKLSDEKYFDDWSEVPSERRSTYVHLLREPRPIQSLTRSYIYDDSGAREATGEYGRQWDGVGNTQDGRDNNGGCGTGGDPESPSLHFAREEIAMIPQDLRPLGKDPARIVGHEFKSNQERPVTAHSRKQTREFLPPPPPGPCPPLLSASNPGTGAVDLIISNPSCPGAAAGYRIYRATGAGSFAFVADVGSSLSYRDHTPRRGVAYRYAATMYNDENTESGFSAEVSITPQDTTPAAVPVGLTATSGDRSATLAWEENYDTDIRGYNVYMSTTSGGPYSKINNVVIPAWVRPPGWTQGGLNNGQTYYFVVTSVDLAGNESAFSAEVAVTPNP